MTKTNLKARRSFRKLLDAGKTGVLYFERLNKNKKLKEK